MSHRENKTGIIFVINTFKKKYIMGIFGKMFGGGGENKQGGKFAQLIEAWKTDLNLTQDQVQKIREAAKSFREERKELKTEGSDRSKIVEARQKVMEQIGGYLDDTQKQVFKNNAAKYDGIMHDGK